MQVAVHRVEADACPWLDLLVEQAAPNSSATAAAEL
jgi:hypothetical protein